MITIRAKKSTLLIIMGGVYLFGKLDGIKIVRKCEDNTKDLQVAMSTLQTVNKGFMRVLEENIKLESKIKELESKEKA